MFDLAFYVHPNTFDLLLIACHVGMRRQSAYGSNLLAIANNYWRRIRRISRRRDIRCWRSQSDLHRRRRLGHWRRKKQGGKGKPPKAPRLLPHRDALEEYDESPPLHTPHFQVPAIGTPNISTYRSRSWGPFVVHSAVARMHPLCTSRRVSVGIAKRGEEGGPLLPWWEGSWWIPVRRCSFGCCPWPTHKQGSWWAGSSLLKTKKKKTMMSNSLRKESVRRIARFIYTFGHCIDTEIIYAHHACNGGVEHNGASSCSLEKRMGQLAQMERWVEVGTHHKLVFLEGDSHYRLHTARPCVTNLHKEQTQQVDQW